jgi:hypothetical protein
MDCRAKPANDALRTPLTHLRKSHLLPLVERLVEARERGADRGGGGAHGGKALGLAFRALRGRAFVCKITKFN